jgi:signal transduction histidine kinase/CheY-like chemotaxis protein
VSSSQHLIWLVDDSALERAMTRKALGPGYAYEEFGDGTEVVEKLGTGARPPDVVLVDWVMPGMSGSQLCTFLRSQPATADLPVVIVTSSRVETEDIVSGLGVGANDYVPKPFVAEELRARVNSILRARASHLAILDERRRLRAINELGRALFRAGSNVPQIFDEGLGLLVQYLADGCGVTLTPGDLPETQVAVHRGEPGAATLSAISTLADPQTFAFATDEDALAELPPLYHDYIRRFGLRGLAILPFPVRGPINGVVTLTRDAGSQPFAPDDIATLETCIEYLSLAVQNAVRFDHERAARAQLAAVLEAVPIGILVCDAGGAMQLTNAVAARLLPGLDRLVRIQDVLHLGVWREFDGTAVEPWQLGVHTNERRVLTFTAGDFHRIYGVTHVLLFAGDQPIGDVTAIEDLTDELAQARERERVAQFQEQLLGIVGHDLRNPLNAVIMGSELLLERTADLPAIHATARRIESSGRRMTSIVGQLLDVTRARLGRAIPLAKAATDLVAIAQPVIDELAVANRTSRVVLEGDNASGRWDPDRLGQVLSNLLSNALAYGDATAPIRVRLGRAADRATLDVTNAVRGEPMPASLLASLFDPYARGAQSQSLNRTGLGLGLYIAHEIVRAHGGTISATSSLAAGTTFHIELPLSH